MCSATYVAFRIAHVSAWSVIWFVVDLFASRVGGLRRGETSGKLEEIGAGVAATVDVALPADGRWLQSGHRGVRENGCNGNQHH